MIREECFFCKRKYYPPTKRSQLMKCIRKGSEITVCSWHAQMMYKDWNGRKAEMEDMMDASSDDIRIEWEKMQRLFGIGIVSRLLEWLWRPKWRESPRKTATGTVFEVPKGEDE